MITCQVRATDILNPILHKQYISIIQTVQMEFYLSALIVKTM